MQILHRFLAPLLACATLLGAPAVQAEPRHQLDRAKLQQVASKVQDFLKDLKAKRSGSTATPTAPAPAPAPTPTSGSTPPPKVLALYDAPAGTPYDKLGFAYTIMLRNLLGHFDAQVDLLPVQQYAAGQVNNYTATFYLGSSYDHQLPAAFLSDAATTTKTLVWFKYNIWQLAWNSSYNFTANRGIQYNALRGMNAAPSASDPNPGFFDTVKYKDLDFVKYYQYDAVRNVINADPDVGVVAVADPAKASAVITMANPKTGETAPYITRSGNFWYVADLPFSFIGPRDRYLVFTDTMAPTSSSRTIALWLSACWTPSMSCNMSVNTR